MNFIRNHLSLIFICLVSIIFFWQFFFKILLPIPSDTIIGLYNPYRDLYAKDYPRGIPFKNSLITDSVRQQYPWRELVISDIKKLEIPSWNPYSFSGSPLIGNFQSAAFYPLNILFFILPFYFSWSFLIYFQVILSLIFTYLYLKNLKLSNTSSIFGSISFSFSGFFISWLEWGTVIQTALWLPLILLSIDKIIQKKNKWWNLIFIVTLSSSLLAGHAQTFFYILIVSAFYILFRSWEIKKPSFILKFLFLLIPIGLLTLPQTVPFLKFVSLSARDVDQNYTTAGWFIPYQNLIQFIVPDFFGNPSTLNYWGIWNYAEFIGYIGILPLILAFYAISRKKENLFFILLIIVSLLFALPNPISALPFKVGIPFISSAQPTRLIFIIDFSLSILSAFGMEKLMQRRSKKILISVLGLIGLILAILFAISIKGENLFKNISVEDLQIAKRNLYFPILLFVINSVGIFTFIFIRNKQKNLILVALILITILDLFRFGWKFTPFTPKQYLFPDTKALSFIKNDNSKYRIMSDDSRILPPNFSTIYRIESVEGYDPLYLRRYAELVSAIERGKPDISTPFGFNRIITPHNYNNPLVELLNVKYLLSLNEINDPKLTKVFQEGDTRVYKFNNFIPRVFSVSKVVSSPDKQTSIDLLYKNQSDLINTAVVEGLDNKEFSSADVKIVNYSDNKVVLNVSSNSESFIVLLDSYYPTWKAKIDDTSTSIYITDYNFRGIMVPKGEHTITFENNLW